MTTAKNKRLRWTNEELELLRKYYPIKGPNIPELLKTRTILAIYMKVKSLSIRRIF